MTTPAGRPRRRSRNGEVADRSASGISSRAPGANLPWVDNPTNQLDRFPTCYQQHETPLISVTVTQYDQHQVRCGCGRLHTATRPEGARAGLVGYGPNVQSFAVYLMVVVVHFIPAKRVVEVLESLTGATPSVGFVHDLLARAANLLAEVDKRIRALITMAYAVRADETRCASVARSPNSGGRKPDKYLLVACTELYTHYLLSGRDLDTFKAFVLKDLIDSVVVHDRYRRGIVGDHSRPTQNGLVGRGADPAQHPDHRRGGQGLGGHSALSHDEHSFGIQHLGHAANEQPPSCGCHPECQLPDRAR